MPVAKAPFHAYTLYSCPMRKGIVMSAKKCKVTFAIGMFAYQNLHANAPALP